jgi:hypothetical protein
MVTVKTRKTPMARSYRSQKTSFCTFQSAMTDPRGVAAVNLGALKTWCFDGHDGGKCGGGSKFASEKTTS